MKPGMLRPSVRPTKEDILYMLWADHSIGIRALAKLLGCRVRDLRNDIAVMERAGLIRIERPGGGYNANGERRIRRAV